MLGFTWTQTPVSQRPTFVGPVSQTYPPLDSCLYHLTWQSGCPYFPQNWMMMHNISNKVQIERKKKFHQENGAFQLVACLYNLRKGVGE